MRLVQLFLWLVIFASCSHRLQVTKSPSSVIDLFRNASLKDRASSANKVLNTYIYERRIEAVKLFNIVTDTSKVTNFIIIDIGNLEGADYFGEIIRDDSLKYFYTSPYLVSKNNFTVEKYGYSPFASKTEDFILYHLKEHRFTELETYANEKGKTLSGSSFYSIGIYEKGMDSVYVKTIPAFIVD